MSGFVLEILNLKKILTVGSHSKAQCMELVLNAQANNEEMTVTAGGEFEGIFGS